VVSKTSKTSKGSGRGRGRGGKSAGKVSKRAAEEELPPPPPPRGPAPPPAAPAAAAPPGVPVPADDARIGGMGLENLLTQQAKDRLQNKIDMLNDQQLEQVLDFLEADVAQEDNDPDQEIQLDLDRLELPKMVALVRLIDSILDEDARNQPAAAAAAASAPAAAPAAAGATGAAQRVLPDAPPTDAIQNSFVSPGDTPLNSPRVAAARPSPSAVGAWSEFNARANLHERHKQAARESIAPTDGASAAAASTAPASQAPPSGCFSMLHDAAEILHMMD